MCDVVWSSCLLPAPASTSSALAGPVDEEACAGLSLTKPLLYLIPPVSNE